MPRKNRAPGLASIVALASAAGFAWPQSLAKDSIAQVATMDAARSAHTATTLRSGAVLLAGGMQSGGGSLAALELFDPTRNTLRRLGDLAARRAGHTATLLDDGRVLIAGGYDAAYLGSVEIFDPATGATRPATPLLAPRSEHTATRLPDGRVLVVGGVGTGWTFLNTAEVYDPRSGRWDSVGAMRTPREGHTATLLPDGRVIVIGGHTGRRQAMEVHASAEIFSPDDRRFSPAGTMVIARHKHDAIALADGRVLVIGGADRTDRNHFASTEFYDARAAAFAPGPTMRQARYKIAGTAVRLPDGGILVPSGARRAEVLDASHAIFREVPGEYPEPFRFAATSAIAVGDVVITGGYDDRNRASAGVWRYRRAR